MAAFRVRLNDGSEMGPLDPQMLRSWYQQGLINGESQVRTTGSKKWVALHQVVDISDWGGGGGAASLGRSADAEAEEVYDGEAVYDPQRWRIFVAAALVFGVAAGAGYFWLHPDQWLPALRPAPWREIALGLVAIGLLLVTGSDPMRKVARVLVFLLTFSLFAVAAPVLLQMVQSHRLEWPPLAVLVSAWILGSGLFFFLAGHALRWTSIALCLFWILAGAAGVGALGLVPPGTSGAASRRAAAPPPDDRLAAPWSPSATQLARELPLLSPRAAELIASSGLDRPEAAFKQTYLLAANGVSRLTAPEAKELSDLTSAVFAPIPLPSRRRLDAYMERVRGLQATQPQEDREMTAIVRDAVLQLPEGQRARYQALYEKALGATR
jgi:hypothetical protein